MLLRACCHHGFPAGLAAGLATGLGGCSGTYGVVSRVSPLTTYLPFLSLTIGMGLEQWWNQWKRCNRMD